MEILKWLFIATVIVSFFGCMPKIVPNDSTANENAGAIQMSEIQNHGTITISVDSKIPSAPEKIQPEIVPRETIKTEIKKDEGLALKPYVSRDKIHIGYGRNLDGKGISEDEADYLFENDFSESEIDLHYNILFDEWQEIPGKVKDALINMRFQLGHDGFMKFKKMINAIKRLDWREMIKEMRYSAWYEQTPERAERLIKKIEEEN